MDFEVDHLPTSGPSSNELPSPLTHVWASRTNRREREDEDLVSDPGSPEPSEDENETDNDGRVGADEPKFLTDDEEPPVHVEISAGDQLTTGFQLHAARAGMPRAATALH